VAPACAKNLDYIRLVMPRVFLVVASLLLGCAGGDPDGPPPADVGSLPDVVVRDAQGAEAMRPMDAGSPDASPEASADVGAGGEAGSDAMPAVRFIGRVDRSDPERVRFTWSGTAVVARFTGTTIGVRMADMANLFEVTLDGNPLPPLRGRFGQELYLLATRIERGPHELILRRRTEAWLGETEFRGLALDPGATLLPPPPPAERRLEFVGDSITCGYGIEGSDQYCPFTPETENHALTYGALATQALGAEAVTIAYSGKGMYRNLGGDMNETVPQLYDRTLVGRPSPWAFSSWIPHAVVINLGTNDFGKGDPGRGYADAYQAFLRRVRANYPQAHILCTLGPMMSAMQVAQARAYLMPVIEAARAAGDGRVSYLEYTLQDGSTGFGCDWHPSRGTHQAMAATLTAELRRLLGW
jgi:lysophospholipase L1-like esterase